MLVGIRPIPAAETTEGRQLLPLPTMNLTTDGKEDS